MTDEFRNQPRVEDWRFPPAVERQLSGMGKDAMALLKESDLEGVPVPLGFRAGAEMANYMERLEAGEVSQVVEDATRNLEQYEERYPDAAMWDRGRAFFAGELMRHGHVQESIDFAWQIRRERLLAKTVLHLYELAPDEVVIQGDIAEGVHRRLTAEPADRQNRLIAGIRDHMIERDPLNPMIDMYNELLVTRGAETDHVAAWAEAQKEELPEADWDQVVQTVRNDAHWTDVPTAFRQRVMLDYVANSREIAEDQIPDDWVADVAGLYDIYEDRYPAASIWGHQRGNLAVQLAARDREAEAIDLALSIRDPKLIGTVALELHKAEREESAVELAERIPDGRTSVEVVMELTRRGSESADDLLARLPEEGSRDQRLAIFEVLRDGLREQGNHERAEHYAELAEEVRREEPD